MMTKEELRDALLAALDRNQALVEQITPEGWEQPTPCRDLDVRGLVEHLTGSCRMFADAIERSAGDAHETPAATTEAPAGADDIPEASAVPGADLAAAYERERDRIRDLLVDPDVLERPWTLFRDPQDAEYGLSIMLLEVVQHGWDLATGLDVDRRYDPALAEELLTRAEEQIGTAHRGPDKSFGPPQPVHEQVEPSDKLAAYLGREI